MKCQRCNLTGSKNAQGAKEVGKWVLIVISQVQMLKVLNVNFQGFWVTEIQIINLQSTGLNKFLSRQVLFVHMGKLIGPEVKKKSELYRCKENIPKAIKVHPRTLATLRVGCLTLPQAPILVR